MPQSLQEAGKKSVAVNSVGSVFCSIQHPIVLEEVGETNRAEIIIGGSISMGQEKV